VFNQQSAIAHGYVDSIQDVTLTYNDMCSNGTASQCRSYFVVLTVGRRKTREEGVMKARRDGGGQRRR
jgi:hypothetical protein